MFALIERLFYGCPRALGQPQDRDVPGRKPGRTTLPLFEAGAVARSFDTPGFRGMTFHEVRARTIINQVPPASRMAFRWTINPYCLAGETRILMADGRTKALAEVRVGDAIYGTVRQGSYHRYVITEVLAHWSTIKSAYRVALEDGTRLICSGDHRFLTGRGWKHVTGAEQGAARRPHLTTNDKLMGVGAFAEPPKEPADYRRGYLCGMVRGDAYIASYTYQAPGRALGELYRFRLALIDTEALDRTRNYLASVGIGTTEFIFAEESATRRRMTAIRTSSRDQVRTIEWLIEWPLAPGPDWRKGFLAGCFDAEGSYSRGILRIGNTDREFIARTISSMRSLGFDAVVERTKRPNGMAYVRPRGGLKEALRFFHTMDPAITRKRTIAGTAIKGAARLGVVSVQPLGLDLPMFDITTGTGDFIADGVVSHNCFARNTHTYLDLDAGIDFNSQIVVKVNAAELARRELAALARRARRDGHERGLLPAGRGALPADARHHRRPAGGRGRRWRGGAGRAPGRRSRAPASPGHPGGSAVTALIVAALAGRPDRKARRHPGAEAAIQVGRVADAEILQCGRRQAGGVALRAHDDDAQIIAGLRQAGGRRRVEAPLKDVALDHEGAGHLALGRPLRGRADVDDERSVPAGRQRLRRADALQPGARIRQDLVDRPAAGRRCGSPVQLHTS